MSRKFKIYLNLSRITGTLHEDKYIYMFDNIYRAEAVGFLRAKKSSASLPSEGK
jgi:hypothetical protein